MHYKDIDKVIISQEKFVRENSNSVSNRIQILNSLLISIKHNESKIYEALKQDLNKHEFESFLSEIFLVKKEIKLFVKKLRTWSKKKRVKALFFILFIFYIFCFSFFYFDTHIC